MAGLPPEGAPSPSSAATPPGAAPPALLALVDVSHRWRRNLPLVLDHLSLSIFGGEIIWIGGPNGVGKTTLLRVAGGILLPAQGSVRLDGFDPRARGREYQRRLGYLSAGDRGLYARMTVTQQLDYWARLAYLPADARPRSVSAAIDAFGLDRHAHHRVDRLSQGWRQRVRLAMAFLHEPAVLLLDEPRNSLDDDGQAVLEEQILAAAKRGAAVLWCSPRGEDRAIQSDRSYTLQAGHLEESS